MGDEAAGVGRGHIGQGRGFGGPGFILGALGRHSESNKQKSGMRMSSSHRLWMEGLSELEELRGQVSWCAWQGQSGKASWKENAFGFPLARG